MRILVVKKEAPIEAHTKNGHHIPDETTLQLLTTPLTTRSSALQSVFDTIQPILPKKVEICRTKFHENLLRDFHDVVFVGMVKGLATKLGGTESRVIKKMKEDFEKNGIYPISENEFPKNSFEQRIKNVMTGNVWNDVFKDMTESFGDFYKMNEVFCKRIHKIYKEGDVVWIVDPALWMLPQMLRKKVSKIKIAVSFTDEFPSGSRFENFEYPEKILESLLNATYLDFLSKSSRNNFLEVCERVFQRDVQVMKNIKLKCCENGKKEEKTIKNGKSKSEDKSENEVSCKPEKTITKITFKGREIICDTNEISFSSELGLKICGCEDAKKTQKNKKVVVSVAKCMETSNILNLYKAVDYYFEKFERDTIFYILEIPGGVYDPEERAELSRMEEYIKMKYGHEAVIRKTGVDDFEYFSILKSADCGVFFEKNILPVVDFLQIGKKQILGNSNFKLHKKNIPVANPNSPEEVSKIIKNLLSESSKKNKDLIEKAKKRLIKNENWFERVKKKLEKIEESGEVFKIPEHGKENEIIEKLNVMEKKAVILDYDGTLTEIVPNHQDAKPTLEILEILKELTKEHKVVICTGRDKNTIDSWINIPEIEIYAEHGVFRRVNGEWLINTKLHCGWKQATRDIMQFYVDRTPQSEIEEKLTSLVFHYSKVNELIGEKQANDLKNSLRKLLKDFKNLKISDGIKIVEVKQGTFDKGQVIEKYSKDYEFVVCCGDDVTDEDMFRVAKEKDNVVSILVGKRPSLANSRVENVKAMLAFLKKIANMDENVESE